MYLSCKGFTFVLYKTYLIFAIFINFLKLKSMKRILIAFLLAGGMSLVNAQEVNLTVNKPLSEADKATVESLMKDFDPNTFAFSANYVDAAGKTKAMKLGAAKGLGSVKMSNTKVTTRPGNAAATVNTNNIFKAATVNTNNIFKAATVNTNNVFKPSDSQLGKMNQLHQILSKYQ